VNTLKWGIINIMVHQTLTDGDRAGVAWMPDYQIGIIAWRNATLSSC
jgi:hypothetical protein